MAKIWPVYEGKTPTAGWPWAHLPLDQAITLLQLRRDDFLSDLDTTPRFGATDRDLTYTGFKHIVVEIERDEAGRANWKPGFYRSSITPQDAFGKLLQQAFAAALGKDNVERVDWQPTIDSQGRDALKITVVIAPDATARLRDDAVLDALLKAQQQLRQMRDDRIPIVEYATEAELAEDAGS